MNNDLIPVYAIYLVATIGLCTWLARSLARNGAVFLADVFADRPEMADAVNHLLVTGFAMLNVGYGFFLMKADGVANGTEAFEVLARKLGILLVSLALFHFANMAVFNRIADHRRQRTLAPPVAPQRWVDEVGATTGILPPKPSTAPSAF